MFGSIIILTVMLFEHFDIRFKHFTVLVNGLTLEYFLNTLSYYIIEMTA